MSHNKWIPELSHNEAFRQYALLNIRKLLLERIDQKENWKVLVKEIDLSTPGLISTPVKEALDKGYKVIAINLPFFRGLLSHFTQPGQVFADEIENRLKVIACIEKPNMTHSEALVPVLSESEIEKIAVWLEAEKFDAQIILWGPEEDIPTAVETVEERMLMAMDGIPPESRKSFPDGTTIFERVLPGRDRMYPDTDSAPIPLTVEYIDSLSNNIPIDISHRFYQMKEWGIPEDTWKYLLSKNMIPLIERIHSDFGFALAFDFGRSQ